ncbi:uncharacterized protein [Acropora muricata]|uniref:uncharacterized protein n=1 Tax=Acropora muricata TaxID=159855 RepID=UPI0034E5DCA4
MKITRLLGGKRKRMANKNLFDSDYITDESEAVTEPVVCIGRGEKDDVQEKQKGKATINSENKGKKKIKVKKQIKSKGTGTTSTPKRFKTPETKKQELTLLKDKLTAIEENILQPVVTIDSYSSSECELSEDDNCSERDEPISLDTIITNKENTAKLQHPHFGGKRPKLNPPVPRCINCDCKQEKQEKDKQIKILEEEVQHLKKELRMLREQKERQSVPSDQCEGSGKMSKEQGNALGLVELVIGSGVWTCSNKLGAAIKDAENKSRTVLVRSLLAIFYSKEELLRKVFSDLDKDIIEACVEFAMVAKLGKVQNVKKSELRQALCCKMNSMKFQSSKPAYYQEYRKNYSGPKNTNEAREA